MNQAREIVCLNDYETVAQRKMPADVFEYVASGVADEITLKANRAAFDRIRIYPRALVDVSTIDMQVSLFGEKHVSPILLAPTGYHGLIHRDGERESIQGANLANCTLVASTFATIAFEEIQPMALRPQWFQLYVQSDRSLTQGLVERVVDAGASAICVTVDLSVNGVRDRENRIGFDIPPHLTRANLARSGSEHSAAPRGLHGGNIYNAVRAADVTWRDIEWLRSMVKVPLLLKGILRPEDALRAIDAGCQGIIVSNHGGRSLDGVESSIDALDPVAHAVSRRVPVLVDGGIRRGTDVLKALGRGATAVLIGRPYLFALGVGGAQAIAEAVEMLRLELGMAMGLAGCPNIEAIDRTLVS